MKTMKNCLYYEKCRDLYKAEEFEICKACVGRFTAIKKKKEKA